MVRERGHGAAWLQASRSYSRRRGRRTLKGPLRALRLCLLAVLLPGLLVAGPLYLRFHIYADQVYPLAMSDMRLLDGRVSTTWCQRQVVRANATFNAFLLPEQPQVAPEKKSVSMVRDLLLEDDMKEYWAFYLLRGSSITVSACVNHPGASLVVIRGHKHLHDCAYIGDNSSEELDEVAEAEARAAEEAQEAAAAAQARAPGGRRSGADAARSAEDDSQPAVRRRVRPEVKLLGAHPPLDSKELLAHPHPHEPDPEDGALRHILNKVAQKRAGVGRRRGGGSTELYKVDGAGDSRASATPSATASPAPPPRRPPPAPAPSLAAGAAPSSSEVFEEVLRKLRALGHRGNAVLRRLNHQLERTSVASEAAAAATAATAHAPPSPPPATAGPVPSALTPAPADSASDEDSSPEADTLTDALGEPGAMDALRELVRRLLKEHADETATQAAQAAGGRRRRASPSPHQQHQQHQPHPPDAPHKRRSAHSPEARLAAQRWSADDEKDNVALEMYCTANHHERVNETEAGDLDSSNSEFWSSFSSSEEALLSCTGLVLNLPLHPHHQCTPTADPGRLHAASTRNTLTYRVPTNGYYFFVFGSENEVQTNYIRAHFHLERVVYNVSSPVASCHNTTQPCALPLDFFSSEKLVLEMPVRPNASLWNEEFLVVSSCEPRTALYVACIVAVPMLIVMFAFQ
ncbi:Uncharacterized protein GBIM_04188 [Gryllus bimaculatus]|nr:Uncharacterized protein GBIM_04188 [Gryllus bimaculatus]